MNTELDTDLDIDKETESKMEELFEFHEEALKKYKESKDTWANIYTQYVSDIKFANGDQWDPSSLKNRKANNRSALIYNKIPANIRFIVNNARSCTPEIKVHPIADGASKNTAKIYDGIIKSIQYKSNAKNAYVKALETAVTGGIGCFRILVEDVDYDKSPEITIKPIKDPTFVIIDPTAENQDLSDANFCFFIKWIPKDEFEELYPDKESAPINDACKDWFKKDQVQVAEYWVRRNGKVDYYLISGEDVLEENLNYPGKYIPFCFVTGTEVYVDGKREYKGIVRDVIDQQRMLNYSKSETADFISRSAKQQWLVEADQISEYQEIWDSQNIESYNYLPFKGNSSTGRPIKIDPPVPPSGFMATSTEADNDIRATIGIRDPLQDIPSSQSGKAIQLQISQGNLGTFEYLDNLNSAIKYAGKIIVDLIPHFYNYQHIREVMGLDENITPTPIMMPYEDNGEIVMHDLKKGYYAVTLSVGPSYESQRSEAADKILELVQKYPSMMQFAGDLIVQNLDFKGAEELADRLRATIPPEVLAASNPSTGDKGQQLQVMMANIQNMQNQLQQAAQVTQDLQNQLAQAGQIINDKNLDRQFELQKKQMELDMQYKLKELDIQLQMAKLEKEQQFDIHMTREKAITDVMTSKALDDHETENDVKEYGEKKLIDLSLSIPPDITQFM